MSSDLLLRLLEATGPSGHETSSAAVWREGCSEFADEVGADRVGSSFARVRGTASGPLLAIVGHIDEIGLHVSHIDNDGYLRFGEVGGWDTMVLVGQRVPYEGLHTSTDAEMKAVGAIRDQFRKQAATGYHAEHALSIVRMPKWEWKKDMYQG